MEDASEGLPTPADQIRAYERSKATYDVLYEQWTKNGKVGSPPPRPVKPHTPGPQPMPEEAR